MRDVNDNFVYESVHNWEGFIFRHRPRRSAHSYEDFLRYPTFEALKIAPTQRRYHNPTIGLDDSMNFLLSSHNQNAKRQTLMDLYFGTVDNNAEEEDSDDDDEGTTIGNANCTDEDAHCTDEE